jgi:sugar-specific transcriptional regulator TrmB
MKDVQDEDVEALASLGLTVLQAKVYLALVKSGNATIRIISKTSKVARQDLYRITSELQKLGLVERVIATPTTFKATELTEGVSILLQRMHKKENAARKKIRKLVQRYRDKSAKTQPQIEEPQFILVPEKEVIRRTRRNIENTQKSLDVITTFNRLKPGIFNFDEVDKKALERGVKLRFITDKPEDENSLTEILKAVTKNPLFEIRYIHNPPLAAIAIYDKKTAVIAISASAAINEVPILMSNNPSLLAVVRSYFETMWSTALKFKPEQP